MLVDGGEQFLASCQSTVFRKMSTKSKDQETPQRNVLIMQVKILHIVAGLHVVVDVAFARASECLDGKAEDLNGIKM
jgi:hypothetical protein